MTSIGTCSIISYIVGREADIVLLHDDEFQLYNIQPSREGTYRRGRDEPPARDSFLLIPLLSSSFRDGVLPYLKRIAANIIRQIRCHRALRTRVFFSILIDMSERLISINNVRSTAKIHIHLALSVF